MICMCMRPSNPARRLWGTIYLGHMAHGATVSYAAWRADLLEKRRHRPVMWQGQRCHCHKRGHRRTWRLLPTRDVGGEADMSNQTDTPLSAVLDRVGGGMTTIGDAHWLHWHIIGLQSRLDRAEGELKGMREHVDTLKRDRDIWHTAACDCDVARERLIEENALLRRHLDLRQRPDDYSGLHVHRGDRGETVTGD